MDPRDVNRINYNNYFVGQNLDFLVRSKMRSESLSTPLKNTPAFYDDQVTSKMSLLGKRGFYDPGYIYGFQNSEQKELNNNQGNNNEEEYTNPITREQYDQLILPKEHYREQLLHNYEMNNNINNNINLPGFTIVFNISTASDLKCKAFLFFQLKAEGVFSCPVNYFFFTVGISQFKMIKRYDIIILTAVYFNRHHISFNLRFGTDCRHPVNGSF